MVVSEQCKEPPIGLLINSQSQIRAVGVPSKGLPRDRAHFKGFYLTGV